MGIAVSKRGRLPLLIGVVVLVAATALLPVALLVEQALSDALVSDRVAVERDAENQRLILFEEEVRRTEASVVRLSNALSATEAELAREDTPLSSLVRQDADGARRSPREAFDPETQAGIWIPAGVRLDPSDERFFVRSQRVIGLFGLGAFNNLFFDTWVLLLTNGEVTFGPELPDFIYDAAADHDYRGTDWVQLANPHDNPQGLPRWTPPSFDPVPKRWMVSVVAPVYVEGRWAGSVGHDVLLSTLLRVFLPTGRNPAAMDGSLHVVAGELLVASSRYHDRIENSRGALKVNETGDDALTRRVAVARAKLAEPGAENRAMWHDGGDYILATRLEMMDGVVLRVIPAFSIERQLRYPLTLLRVVLFGSMAVTLGLILVLVLREERRRRLMETALIDQNEHLERLVAERVEELHATNQALEAAKDSAVAAARAKSDFLAIMSHEIRTPMNGVLGMTRLVLGDDPPPKVRERLGLVVSSAEALLTILDDILDFSKLEAGRLEFEHAPFALGPTLAGVLDLMQVRAQEKGLSLHLDRAETVPAAILGDAVRLRQILLNLLGNAVKFTDAGSVTLRVRPETGGWLLFEVEDSGIGMDEETARRIFESFTQADASISRRFGGTGLGLAICRRLVEGQGGTIGVDSRPGQGSRFWFRLPLEAAGEVPASPAMAEHTPVPSSLRVLLAEDNEINRQVALGFLARDGHRVTCARNGREAVEFASQGAFELVLMDMQMPEMDGLEATRSIRALPPPANAIPIVALTANALAADIARCLEAGMNGHVAKPIDPRLLQDALRRVHPSAPYPEAPPPSSQMALAAMRRTMGDKIARELMEMFLSTGAQLVERLASAGDDLTEIAEAAHSLRGMAPYGGATDLAALASEMEIRAKDGDATVISAIPRVQEYWKQAAETVQAELQNPA